MLPIITPFADKQMAKALQRSLAEQGMGFRLESRVTAGKVLKKSVTLTIENASGETEELNCDKVLVAVGRRPMSEGAGIESAGVSLDDAGRVAVGASCAFMTPVGHQSNALVMAPGGYLFGDYWSLGLPLSVIVTVVAVPLIHHFWPMVPR